MRTDAAKVLSLSLVPTALSQDMALLPTVTPENSLYVQSRRGKRKLRIKF